MNILYLSHLSGALYAGPTYSVPKQIEAQSKLDNVFWYNATKSGSAEWKSLPYYHDLSEYPEESIRSLPEPFNHPDVIVVELFYNMTRSKLRKELVNGDIPYIIIPRGELTKQAQARKSLKKRVANALFCTSFAQKAAAIQYLTKQEFIDSGDKWNKNHIIIPNGITLPEITKTKFSENGIKCVSIGRIEPYQKGLDMLVEACSQIKEFLQNSNCTFTICGPDKEGKLQDIKNQVESENLQGVITFREGVYGKEKEALLLESDVFVMTSRFEGHPMALIEALSYGLPCVATTGSNMREAIQTFCAGWTADCNTVDIVSALTKMVLDSKQFTQYGVNAQKLAGQYSWPIIAQEQHITLKKIIAKSRG